MAWTISFTVPGSPVPFTRVLKGSKQDRAIRYRNYKTAVGWSAKDAGAEPWDGPIRVNVQIYERNPEKRRYDIDNVLKGILDSLNGVCFLDDKQVTAASVAIYSDPEPEVRVTVTRTP